MKDKLITILGKEIILRETITIPELYELYPEAIVENVKNNMYSLNDGYKIDGVEHIRTLNKNTDDLPIANYSSLKGVGKTFGWLGNNSENIQHTRLFVGYNYNYMESPNIWDKIEPYQLWTGFEGDENTTFHFLSVKDDNEFTVASPPSTIGTYKVTGKLTNGVIHIPIINEP